MDCVGSEYDSVNDINPSEDLGLERESKTYDGQATVSAHLIAFLLLKKYGILVNPNYLVGYDMQLRTRGAVCVKTFVDIVDIKQIKEKANAVKEFDPNYVFIGDESKGIVNAIFDGDAVKLANRDLFNSCEPVELLFLESAKAMGASLSPQILNSILAMEESFNNDGSNIVAEQLINKAKLEGERSLEGEVYSSISLSGNSQNIFFAVNRGAALTDRYAMNNLVGSLDKKIISSVSNVKVSAEGYSGRALFDNTSIFMRKALLGLKSLSTKDVEVRSLLGVREVEVVTDNGIKSVQAIEVYSPYLLDKYSDEIDAIQEAFESDVISIGEAEAKAIRTKALNKLLLTIGYKFPSVSVFENIPTVAVTDFELDEREEMYSIEGNDEFNRRLSLAKKWLTDRKAGTVVVAPEDLAKQEMNKELKAYNTFAIAKASHITNAKNILSVELSDAEIAVKTSQYKLEIKEKSVGSETSKGDVLTAGLLALIELNKLVENGSKTLDQANQEAKEIFKSHFNLERIQKKMSL